MSGRYLEPTAARLASDYRTLVPDLPGYGWSDNPRRPLTIPELAEALGDYLDAAGVPRAVILGHSMGCLVTTEFAHRYPQRVERAVLVSPAGGPHNQPLVRAMTQLASATLREPLSLARITASEYVRFGLLNSVRAFHRMTEYPTLERLSKLPIPFLAVLGTLDPLVSRPRMTRILQSTGRMDQVFEVNAAHAINFSHPETLSRIVDAYLRDQPLPAPTDDDRSICGENEHRPQGV
jgi:pimeloyl-ACP methyl ester carboxylesterase